MIDQDAEAATETPLSVEDIIETSLGNMSWNQILQAILAAIPPIFDNQQTLISVFTDAQPPWHCISTNRTICRPSSNICNIGKSDWTWTGNKHSSIISDWDLECSSSFMKSLPTTSFFVGCLISGFLFASLGDTSLGRKNLLFISLLTMSIAGFACAFSLNIWFYSAFRFVCGVGRVSITICACVLLPERVGRRWRGQIVLLGIMSLTFGLLSLTGLAFLTRNSSWQTLYLWTSIPAIVYSGVIYFFMLESPRWLFMRGRHIEALDVLKRLSSMEFSSSTIPNMLKLENCKPCNVNPFLSIQLLAKKRWAIHRLIVTIALSFGVGMMYFGMFLGVGNLGLNIYISSIINALVFLLSSLFAYLFWIQRCNRRSSTLCFCAISGAASIVSIFANSHHEAVHVGLEWLALFCACKVFNILFMYTVELFPTCVRNTAVALSRQAMLFASIFVPVVVVLGRSNKMFSPLVYGLSILLCGLLVLTLPETRGKDLCDTMEEQEARDKI